MGWGSRTRKSRGRPAFRPSRSSAPSPTPSSKITDDAKRRQASVAGSLASLIRDLLEATNPDGTPNLPLRDKGAELAYKHPDYLEAAEEESGQDLLPEGVIVLYPLPDQLE